MISTLIETGILIILIIAACAVLRDKTKDLTEPSTDTLDDVCPTDPQSPTTK